MQHGSRPTSAAACELHAATPPLPAFGTCLSQAESILRRTDVERCPVRTIPASMEKHVLPPSGTIALVAINAERNVRRRWSIELVEDMFGWWTLTTRWGRIGTRGRDRTVAHADLRAANREAEACLGRRSSAPNRLGVPFAITRGDVQE
jgi:predicted DNA-binding WGR domain protein